MDSTDGAFISTVMYAMTLKLELHFMAALKIALNRQHIMGQQLTLS